MISASTPTVLVVEDDDDVRARICSAINAEPSLALLADVGSVHGARSVLGRQLPRLALIDLQLPDGSGSDLIRWLSVQDEPVDSTPV